MKRLPALLVCLALNVGLGRAQAEEFYFATDINGITCGYTRIVTSPLRQDGRELLQLKQESLTRMIVLGRPVDNRLMLTYHIDPASGRFVFHDSLIIHGTTRLESSIQIEGNRARIISGKDQQLVSLPDGVVLANTLFYPHILEDFVGQGLKEKTYPIFDGRDGTVQETTFSRVSEETLRLAGREVATVVVDSLNRRTGQRMRLWLETSRGIAVKKAYPGNQLSYLADAAVVGRVQAANMDSSILTASNRTVEDPRAIAYLKVRLMLEPSGLWLAADSLNVPGQRFSGTVKDNRVEGVFEIEHHRYDGSDAPPFPPDFGSRAELKEFLDTNDMIQSNDPLLAAAAREITLGAKDSWEAVRLLSRWVADNIHGAIPGGITARGTYDQRAGDCGGHSFLLAAFCRSLGIPARVVWGCVHTGKSFGQHGWNEVFMGRAGWIPIDATLSEIDFLDSGHVRIGHFQSLATGLNLRQGEVLEFRLAPAQR